MRCDTPEPGGLCDMNCIRLSVRPRSIALRPLPPPPSDGDIPNIGTEYCKYVKKMTAHRYCL